MHRLTLGLFALLLFPLTAQAQTNAIETTKEATGLTLTFSIRESSSSVVTGSMTESPASSGYYIASIATVNGAGLDTAGSFPVDVLNGSTVIQSGTIEHWNGNGFDPPSVNVTSIAAGAITATSVASDAITAAKIASDAGAEIASSVRTNLATELGRLDAAVSTRLATAGYTVPPTAAENAAAVLGATLSDTGAGKAGRALMWLANAFGGDGVFDADALANGPGVDAAEVRAAIGLAAANLDAQLDGIEAGGQTQPRVNYEPDPAFTRVVPSGADGSSRVALPVNIPAGNVGDQTVALDMSQLYGRKNFVQSVGTPVVTGAGTVTATAEGPRDWYAMVTIDGTVTAGQEASVTVPVQMVTGATRTVRFVVRGVP